MEINGVASASSATSCGSSSSSATSCIIMMLLLVLRCSLLILISMPSCNFPSHKEEVIFKVNCVANGTKELPVYLGKTSAE